MVVHDGHRQRLIKRFLEQGLEGFEPHQVLELLLFYSIPRKDTNELAHELIKQFGSIAGVLNASYNQLLEVPGVGPNTAAFLTLMPALFRRYAQSSGKGVRVSNEKEAGDLLRPRFMGVREETVYAIFVDGKGKCLTIQHLYTGSIASAQIHVRKLVGLALQHEAMGIILGHNHPRGLAIPSPEDVHTTRHIKAVLQTVGIQLLDHLIFADGEFVSMRQSGAV